MPHQVTRSPRSSPPKWSRPHVTPAGIVLHGDHDLNANYLLSRYVLEQTTRAPGARERLFFGTYPGGHMFYLRAKSRAEFTADVRGFFEQAP